MSEAIVFISHFQIKAGKLDAYRRMQREITQQLEAEKPRTLGYVSYLDETATRLTIVHIFPDAAAMDAHFEGSDRRSAVAYELLIPDGWEIYGTPGSAALQTMREEATAAGVTLRLQPELVAGFLRPTSR